MGDLPRSSDWELGLSVVLTTLIALQPHDDQSRHAEPSCPTDLEGFKEFLAQG